MKRQIRPAEERFWEKVDKSGECWIWTAARSKTGYGVFSEDNTAQFRAHRYSWVLANGPIPDGLILDHVCRVRACVNPAHLRLSTRALNVEHQNGHRDSKSGYRGVGWRANGKWRVTATKGGKTHYGGNFDDVLEAAEAARLLRLELFTHNDLDRKEIPA